MRQKQAGFSLFEVIVSFAIFSTTAIGVAQTFAYQTKTNSNSEIRSKSIQAAQRVLDKLRTDDPSGMPTTGSDAPLAVSIDGRIYYVTVSYCQLPSFCTSATTRHLRASVTHLGIKRYEVDTVYAQLR